MLRRLSFPLIILFKILLDILYLKFVTVYYQGYFPLDVSIIKVVESYILLIVMYLLIHVWAGLLKKPSYIAIYMIFLTLFVPMLSFYGLSNSPREMIYASFFSQLIVLLIVRFIKPLKIFYIKEGYALTLLIIIPLTFYVFAMLIMNGGLSRFNLTILDVYDIRASYGANTGFLMGYFLSWQAYVINLFVLSYALYKKKRSLIVLVLIAQVTIFGMSGFKSMLFAPLLVFALHYFLNVKKMKSLLPFLTFGSVVVLLISLVTLIIKNDIIFASIFVRRLFFVPAQLHFVYYEFFQNNPFVLLSNSIFSGFIDNPYGTQHILFLISNSYFNQDIGVNVGYIGNAYMNFGLLGIFFFSILLGFILKLLDSLSLNLPVSVAASIIIMPSSALVNSGLFTVMLTHGFLLAILLLWLMNSWFKKTET